MDIKKVRRLTWQKAPDHGHRRMVPVTNTSLPAPPATRELRGLALYREHGDEIRFDSVEKVWLVPSQHELGTSVYEVTHGRRGEFCECIDFEIRHPEGGCKHIVAATIAKAKTATCSGCSERNRLKSSRNPVSKSLHNPGPINAGSLGSGEYLSKRVARCLDYCAYRGVKRRIAPVLLDKDS